MNDLPPPKHGPGALFREARCEYADLLKAQPLEDSEPFSERAQVSIGILREYGASFTEVWCLLSKNREYYGLLYALHGVTSQLFLETALIARRWAVLTGATKEEEKQVLAPCRELLKWPCAREWHEARSWIAEADAVIAELLQRIRSHE